MFSRLAVNGARSRKIFHRKARSMAYFDLWTYDGTLQRMHHVLYQLCREQAQREASPTVAIIDSQSVKSAEKGGRALIRTGTMRERRSRARSGTFLSIQ